MRKPRHPGQGSEKARISRAEALEAWPHIGQALAKFEQPVDLRLAGAIARYVQEGPFAPDQPRIQPSRDGMHLPAPSRSEVPR